MNIKNFVDLCKRSSYRIINRESMEKLPDSPIERYYHVTIKAHLDCIMRDGKIKPGMESIKRTSEEACLICAFGLDTNLSRKHVYAWANLDFAINSAKHISEVVNLDNYSLEDRMPVVIPFLSGGRRVSKDPESGEGGMMIEGEIDKFEKPIILEAI